MKNIELLNGTVLECEPRRGSKGKEPDNYSPLLCFVKNAWFFYHHRQRIYSESKLFLAKVPIKIVDDGWYFVLDDNGAKSELYKRNDYEDWSEATLGGMLEYWETNNNTLRRNGECDFGLIYQLYKESCKVHAIRQDGTSYVGYITISGMFNTRNIFVNDAHKDIHERYEDARRECEALTLEQVRDLLVKEQGASKLDEEVVQNEQLKFELRYKEAENKFLKRHFKCDNPYSDDLIGYIAYLRRDEIMPFYEKQVEAERKMEIEVAKINKEIREKRKEVRRGGDPAAQREYQELIRKKNDNLWYYNSEWTQFYQGSDSAKDIMELIKRYEQLDEAEHKRHFIPNLPANTDK